MRVAWNKGKKLTKEHIENLRRARKGVPHKEWKGKISCVCEQCKSPYRAFPYLKGTTRFCSMQCRLDWLSVSKRGPNHHNWKGGQARYKHTKDRAYKQWRLAVFTRDNFTCQSCPSRGCYLEAHHIKSWARFPELRFDIANGVTLCLPCHELTDNYRNKQPKS